MTYAEAMIYILISLFVGFGQFPGNMPPMNNMNIPMPGGYQPPANNQGKHYDYQG